MKKHLGQFFTTNYEYILSGFEIPTSEKNIIEPFAGEKHLIKFLNQNNNKYDIKMYDLDPKSDDIIKQDTITNPPNYNNSYIITNPPYLAKNKSGDKKIFNKYKQDDLYKCFIKTIIQNNPNGGIIIIPLNFLSSIRKADVSLRKEFFKKFKCTKINLFEERVFDDTSYTIISLQFEKNNMNENLFTKMFIFPSGEVITFALNELNNYTIGGEIYNLQNNNNYNITRLTLENIEENYSNILVKCIDDNIDNKINLSFVDRNDVYIDNTKNLSARSYMTLIIKPEISEDEQKKLCDEFNEYLNDKRFEFNSLFLSNYRESKNGFARKRISFSLVYKICLYLLDGNNCKI